MFCDVRFPSVMEHVRVEDTTLYFICSEADASTTVSCSYGKKGLFIVLGNGLNLCCV